MLVDVYRNLKPQYRKVRMYSSREVKSRIVVSVAPSVVLEDCVFKVSAASQQRVRQNKRKVVHAVIRGNAVKPWQQGKKQALSETIKQTGTKVLYNPYVNDTFVTTCGCPITAASAVECGPDGVYATGQVCSHTAPVS